MSHRSITLVAALALLAASGCNTTPRMAEERTTQLQGELLVQAQPADIALPPVRNQSGDDAVPTGLVRERLYRGLIERMYSPLDLAFVDARWTEAGSAGLGADAELHVVVTDWDTSWIASNGVLIVSADVYLLDPDQEAPLWGLSLTRRFEVTQGRYDMEGATGRDERAARMLAEVVLELLPERNPLAEPR